MPARVPWDVPVRLVDRAGLPEIHREVTRPVELGLALSGVAGVTVTTVEGDGRRLLYAIRPVRAPGPGMPTAGSSPRPEPLEQLLAALADADGLVPVLAEGTPFTRAVLTALSQVALGERVSYAELAARAGRPRAVRAAAHVMATNRVPLVLPCHRVVPSSGGTGRYGWGDAVKPLLLAAEAAVTAQAAGRAGLEAGPTGPT